MQHEVKLSEGDVLYVEFKEFPGLHQEVSYNLVLETALQGQLNLLRAQNYGDGMPQQAQQNNLGWESAKRLKW